LIIIINDSRNEIDKNDIKQFWKHLWSSDVCHNKDAKWLLTLKQHFVESVHPQTEFKIISVSVSNTIKKFANWKVPGSDAVHAVWLKHLPSLHYRIAEQLQEIFDKGPPVWMTTGRTI